MKKIIFRILTVTMLAAMLLTVIVACDKDDKKAENITLSGTYSNLDSGTGVTFEFTADMTVKTTRMSTYRTDLVAVGTYAIADGKITITYTEREVGTEDIAAKYSGELAFETGDGLIKIGGTEYKKI